MPRFLNSWTGEFEWHNDPAKIVYAILSHTWRSPADGGEQTFDDVRALQIAVTDELRKRKTAVLLELKALETLTPSLIPRVSNILAHLEPTLSCVLSHPKLSDKIKGVCKVTRDAHIQLVWNDACCIDKSSSAELSEAINSMYELYRLSQVCYVYLEDVPDGDEPRDPNSNFRQSKWHTRGWTLQELIAPDAVEFLTKTWRLLGTKIGLAATLENISGVDFTILTGQATVYSASVARRMSWASRRQTTRIEDRAYSLMGIFGIHMSPIYGEGDNAFLRLQEEIVRTIPDQSIFAWGNGCILTQVSQHDFQVQRHFDWAVELGPGPPVDDPSLIANGLGAFLGGAHITPIAPSAFAARLRLQEVPSLHCVFTPHGVRVRLLSLHLASLVSVHWMDPRWDSSADCLRMPKTDTLALLQCEDESGSLIALPLRQPHDGDGGSGRGMFIGTHIRCHKRRPGHYHGFLEDTYPIHTVRLTKVALAEILEHIAPAIIEVYLLRHHSEPASTKLTITNFCPVGSYFSILEGTTLLPAGDRKKSLAFRIPPRDIEALRILGFVAETPLQVQLVETADWKSFTVNTSLAFNDGHLPSRTKECPQTIQLTFTLKIFPQRLIRSMLGETSDVITAKFCIVNSIGVPAGDSPVQTSPPAIPGLGGVNDPSESYVMMRAPCVDGNEDPSLEIGMDLFSYVRDRVMANAEFTIYSDPDWEKETCTVRFLRISSVNGHPLGGVVTSLDDLNRMIYLSIQLSEKYRHTRCIAGRTLPGDLPPSQTDNIHEPATLNQCSSDNSTSKDSDAEVLEGTDPTVSVATSEQPEESVPSCVSTQTPLSEELTTSQVSGRPRCSPLSRHHSERNGHEDATAGAPGIAPPCDVRSATSSETLAKESGANSSYTVPPSSSSKRPEGVRELVSEDMDSPQERCKCSDLHHCHENDTLRAQVSTMQAQIADLMSDIAGMSAQNAVLSAQMATILARLDAPSAS